MGWDWDANKKGNIIRFWFYDGTVEPMTADQLKFNYNIKTEKISNFRIYRPDKRTDKLFDKINERGYDKYLRMHNKIMTHKKPGYRDAIKYLGGIPPPAVNKFVNAGKYFKRSPVHNKMYTIDGVKCKYIIWGFTDSQIKKFTEKDLIK
jgi:hypothetical protein